MLELLDRTLHEPVVVPPPRVATGPPKGPPRIEVDVTTPWPRSAKIVTTALLMLAIVGAFGTIVNWNRADDTDTYQAQAAQLTQERDNLRVERQELQAEINRVTTDLQAAQAEADRLDTQLGVTASELATIRLERTAVEQDLTAAETRIDELTGRVIELNADNDALTADLATVEADRDALAKLFPVTVDPVLARAGIAGTYDATWIRAYNEGLPTITVPTVRTVTITRTAEGWLRVTIPGVVTANLTRSDGALFTMVDTTTAVPAVNGTVRTARVALTVYATSTTVARDGTVTVDGLGLSIAISTPAVAGAPAGVALYGAELTPTS
jgi:cell division protein FtsB